MPSEERKAEVKIGTFQGLHTNSDPRDLETGEAQTMTNITTIVPGELRCRKGHASATFSNNQASASVDVIGAYRLVGVLNESMVYQTSDGAIRVGKSAT